MKILIVNFEYPPLGGGGGVATRDIAEQLAPQHTVHVLTTGFAGIASYEERSGVVIHRVPVWGRTSLPTASLLSLLTFVPSAFIVGWRLCVKHKFDVLNAQFVIPSGLPVVVLATVFRIPFVLSLIGGDIYDPSKGISPHRHAVLRWLIRRIAARADRLTAISEDTKRRAQELHGIKKPIEVTHLGLIPPEVLPSSREQLGLPKHVPLFVSIGRLIPRKGYDVLLEAWRDIPTAHLVILGSGPLEEELNNYIKRYDLDGRVQLLGFVEESTKQQILRSADAYISSTEHEGFGIVFLEAMEAGLPIIASDRGGHRDFLLEGENAILVPVHDVKQLTAAVVWMLRDGRMRDRMVEQNRLRVKDFYLDKTVAHFEQVLIEATKHNK